MRNRTRLVGPLAALALVASAIVGVNVTPAQAVGPDLLPMTITNNSGRGDAVHLYVLGTNLNNGRLGYVNAAGQHIPWSGGSNPPSPAPEAARQNGPGNGQSVTVRIPIGLSGRIWMSFGDPIKFFLTPDGLVQPAPWNPSDPNANVLFDSSEFTYNRDGLWLNSTQVDVFAIPHAVTVTGSNGVTRRTGDVKSDGRNGVINAIRGQAGFDRLVSTRADGTVLRVWSPGKGIDAGVMDRNYLAPYIDTAWNAYTGRTLTVVPFANEPNNRFFGRTEGSVMHFTNGAGQRVASFNKPTTANVWGCDGNLLAPNDLIVGPIARTLCAALHRSTLGFYDQEPRTNPAEYYVSRNGLTDHYSRIIHSWMADGKAYGFAFDDVNAQESLVHDGDPRSASVILSPFGAGGPQPGGGGEIRGLGEKCVDVRGANPANGTPVQIYDCNASTAQKWTRVGNTLRAYDKCMDISDNGTANGKLILLWPCTGGGNQEWVARGDGSLFNPRANRCLDLPNGNTTNSTQLIIWDCTGGTNQRWRHVV